VNKIPPNFDTLFATSLEGLQLFKGLTARRLQRLFGVKDLMAAADIEPRLHKSSA
jgi:hypothetical protein